MFAFPRYKGLCDIVSHKPLLGLQKRIEKLKVDANRDRINQLELDKIYNEYDKLKAKAPKGQPASEDFEEIYWMIEELRISLFAQQLGTKYPISAKRIKQAMEKVTFL